MSKSDACPIQLDTMLRLASTDEVRTSVFGGYGAWFQISLCSVACFINRQNDAGPFQDFLQARSRLVQESVFGANPEVKPPDDAIGVGATVKSILQADYIESGLTPCLEGNRAMHAEISERKDEVSSICRHLPAIWRGSPPSIWLGRTRFRF